MVIQIWKRELKRLASMIAKYSKTLRPLSERSRARFVVLVAHAAHIERLLRHERRLTQHAFNYELNVRFFPRLGASVPRGKRLLTADYAEYIDDQTTLRAGETGNVLIHIASPAVIRDPRSGAHDLLCTSDKTANRLWCLSVQEIAAWFHASSEAIDGDETVQVEHLDWNMAD